jgi:hypothetical protein
MIPMMADLYPFDDDPDEDSDSFKDDTDPDDSNEAPTTFEYNEDPDPFADDEDLDSFEAELSQCENFLVSFMFDDCDADEDPYPDEPSQWHIQQRIEEEREQEEFVQKMRARDAQRAALLAAKNSSTKTPSIVRTGNQIKSDEEKQHLAELRQRTKDIRKAQASTPFYRDFVLGIWRDKTGNEEKTPPSILKPSRKFRKIQPLTSSTDQKVTFSPGDTWILYGTPETDPEFGTVHRSNVPRRHLSLSSAQWRANQTLLLQLQGKHVKEARWHSYSAPYVHFATHVQIDSPIDSKRISQMVPLTESGLSSKQWRLQHFSPKPLRQWENDERALWALQQQAARRAQKLRERALHQQEDAIIKQHIHADHLRMEASRLARQEALHSQEQEMRRQMQRSQLMRAERKMMKLQRASQQQAESKMKELLHPPMIQTQPINPQAVTSCPSLTFRSLHPSRRSPPHRKVVRKKSRHRLVVWTCPKGNQTQTIQTSPTPQPFWHPCPPTRGGASFFRSSSTSSLSWHQAWIAPTHRKTLRQQPF